MKKILSIFLIIILYPINILAYSTHIIPGGENIGININSNGLIVVGFYKVNGEYFAKESLKIGDLILEIEGRDITSIKEMTMMIESFLNRDRINITIKRNNVTINTILNLKYDDNKYKTGIYVKDKVSGIGTLTYIDPITKIYGALGHEIVISDTNSRVEVKNGNIFSSIVKSIDRSYNGEVGSKNASIDYNTILGNINKNNSFGIYGLYKSKINKEAKEIIDFENIKIGKALIYTTINNNIVKEYEIEIISKSKNLINTSKSLSFIITDKELLKETGGIIQGMSGSPIIQNNKLVGAITHVIVDDVTKGYAIYIRTMLEEGER